MDKYLYFRAIAVLADDDSAADSAMFSAKGFIGGHPTSDTALTLFFEPQIKTASAVGADEFTNNDSVVLTTDTNKAKEALADIVAAINAHPNGDPCVIVADDVSSVYLGSGNITACASISIAAAHS